MAAIGVGLVLVVVVLPYLAVDPNRIGTNLPLQAPSGAAWFGTDQLGRDLFSRMLYGARISLLVAIGSAGLAVVLGTLLGATAATAPPVLSALILRLLDIALALPGILLAVVLAAAIGPKLTTTILVLGLVYTPSMARVVRAAVFKEMSEDYVTAARLIGTRRVRLVGYHVGVNAAAPVLVYTTLIMGDAIVAEAALSFVGAGIRPPEASWGNIMRDGQLVIETGAWWLTVIPGVAIVLSVLLLNRFSEAIGREMRSE